MLVRVRAWCTPFECDQIKEVVYSVNFGASVEKRRKKKHIELTDDKKKENDDNNSNNTRIVSAYFISKRCNGKFRTRTQS